jgi:hypothetical protein
LSVAVDAAKSQGMVKKGIIYYVVAIPPPTIISVLKLVDGVIHAQILGHVVVCRPSERKPKSKTKKRKHQN